MKKQMLAALLCGALAAGTFSCVTQAADSELKGPGNVALKRLGYNVAFDPNEDIMAGVIKDVTGYDVEYFTLPAENADEKLVMDVAGGADYDCIQVSPKQFQILMSQGALMELNDLLDAYGQDILAGVSEDTWRASSDENGSIYGIPYKTPYDREVGGFMACRWDLMQEAGIESVPTTIDELYDDMVKLKEYYGDQYIIFSGPYISGSEGNGKWVFPESIACAFGIYSDWMVDEEGNAYYMTEADGFEDLVNFITKCRDEGLIDPDWVVNSASTVCEKFSGGKSIITSINRNGLGTTTPAMLENLGLTMDDLRYIGALKGSDGTCKFMSTEAVNQYTVILKGAENAADVVNWINLKQQNQLLINIGEEGVHFNYDENGSIEPINPTFAEERGNAYWYNDSTNEAEFKEEWPARVRKSDAQWAGFEAVTLEANKNYPEIFVDNPFSFKPATEKYSKYNTALSKNLDDFILQIISGTKSLDDLEQFQADFEANGGEEVREELQNWYKSFYNM